MSYLDFTVFHVGGKGGIGDGTKVLKLCKNKPNNAELYIFEADLSDEGDLAKNDKYIQKMKQKNGFDTKILQYCVSDHNGVENFYINRDRASSSMFKMAPEMETYNWPPMTNPMWKDHCSVDETREVKVSTFDFIYENDLSIIPDVLSMDAQGSELDIMNGASKIFEGDPLSVITEVEFREIYDKQPLFSDQDSFLRDKGFIFANFFHVQEWFPGPPIGNPFFTVGEVVFLKDYRYLANKYENDVDTLIPLIFKLAAISNALGFSSYAYRVLDHIAHCNSEAYKSFVHDSVDEIVIRTSNFYKDNK